MDGSLSHPQCRNYKAFIEEYFLNKSITHRRFPNWTGLNNLSILPSKCYPGSNISFAAPQVGQTQSSGIASKAVPGFTPLSGSPFAGS